MRERWWLGWLAAPALVLLLAAPGCDSGGGYDDEASGESEEDVSGESEEDVAATVTAPYGSTPQETIELMVELLDNGDYDTFVDDFYVGAKGLQSDTERADVINRLKLQYDLIDRLRQLREVEPEFSEDGQAAYYRVEGVRLSLYRDGPDRWRFGMDAP